MKRIVSQTALVVLVVLIAHNVCVADWMRTDIYNFLSITDHNYVRCSDNVYISKDNKCVDEAKSEAAIMYKALHEKYSSNLALIGKIWDYYRYWVDSINSLDSEANNRDVVDNRIRGILKRKGDVQHLLE